MKRSAEEGSSAEAFVGEEMIAVLSAIVVSKRAAEASGKGLKGLDQGAAELSRTAFGEKTQLGKACFSLVKNKNDARGFVVAGSIDLPMAGDPSGVDGLRALRNGNALGDVELGVFARNKAAMHPLAMAFREEGNEVAGAAVDPLIDGFVTDGKAWQVEGYTPRD